MIMKLFRNVNLGTECYYLHSIWRPSTHRTWSELESVNVFIMLLILGWEGHCHIANAFLYPQMITRHGLMFVFPNRTINRPINHARVHNITDTISTHDNKLTLTLSPLQVEISKFISADLQFLFIHVIDFMATNFP